MKEKLSVKNLILCGGVEDAEYRQVETEMLCANRGIVKGFSLLSAVVLAAMFFLSFIVPSFTVNKLLYGVACGAALLIWLLAVYSGKNNPSLMLADMYLFAVALLGVGIVLGTVLGPREISATYIAFLLAVPQLFTDRPYRMHLLILSSVAIFIVTVISVKDKATWSSDITNAVLFGLISIILSTYSIANRVSRYCLQEKIRFMAENDQLTGLLNRNYYEQTLSRISVLQTNSIYCVYVDVNGLHELNNEKGHDAGDRMLQYVASVMKNLFGENVTYRIGGDEFVALGMDQDLGDIRQLVTKLKQAVESAGYHIAVGISHKQQNGIAVNGLVKEAEMEMYEDKALYYQQSGKERRRPRHI